MTLQIPQTSEPIYVVTMQEKNSRLRFTTTMKSWSLQLASTQHVCMYAVWNIQTNTQHTNIWRAVKNNVHIVVPTYGIENQQGMGR